MLSPGDAPASPRTLPPSPVGRPEPLTLTHGAIGQLEARGAEALVGASRVLALASQAAALGVFTLIHICRVTQGGGQPMAAPPKGRSQRGGLQRTWHLPEETGPIGASFPCKAVQLGEAGEGAFGERDNCSSLLLSQLPRLWQLTQCPPWGQLAYPSNPGLGWPNPTALIMAEMAEISLRNNWEGK